MQSRVFVPDDGNVFERAEGIERGKYIFFIHRLWHLCKSKKTYVSQVVVTIRRG